MALTPEQLQAMFKSQKSRELAGLKAAPVTSQGGADIQSQFDSILSGLPPSKTSVVEEEEAEAQGPSGIMGKLQKAEDKLDPLFKWTGANLLKDLNIGFMKDIGKTIRGASEIGERIIGAPVRAITGEEFDPSGRKVLTNEMLEKEGFGQKTGGFAEQAVELFAPVPSVGKAKAVSFVGSKLNKLKGAFDVSTKAIDDVFKFGGQTFLKTGDKEKALDSGLFAGGLGVAGKGIQSTYKFLKDIPGSTKLAEFMSNTRKSVFQFAKEHPGEVKKYKEIVDDPSIANEVGEKLFDFTKQLNKAVGSKWEATEKAILEKAGSALKEVKQEFRGAANNIFKEEGIKLTQKGKVNLDASKFAQDAEAKTFFQKIYNIMKDPAHTTEAFLNKRQAISGLMSGVKNYNIRRVGGDLMEVYNKHIDSITKGQYSGMRDAYKEGIDPVKKILKGLTVKNEATGVKEFSADKAGRFISELASDFKFDKQKLLGNVQKQLKDHGITAPDFIKEMKAMGTAKKIYQDAPPTGSRMKDVVLSLGFMGGKGQGLLLGTLTSPRFWAGVMTKEQAVKASESAKDIIFPVILQKMLTDLFVDNE